MRSQSRSVGDKRRPIKMAAAERVGESEMTNDPLAKAHQAIGAYFCAFSELERELGEALKIVLQLRGNPAADAIVALVGDFKRKASIVREAIQHARNANWTEPTDEWKAKADKTMGDILGCNNPGRVGLAHDYLEPHPDGSVSLQKPGQPKTPWTSTDFAWPQLH